MLNPRFRDHFREDLIQNLMIRSNQGTIQLYKHHVLTEGVMYSCDMCIEFHNKSDGLLTSAWIEHISREVAEALKSILPRDMDNSDVEVIIEKVNQIMKFPIENVQEEVDTYYNRL